jgi:hypothetical protein
MILSAFRASDLLLPVCKTARLGYNQKGNYSPCLAWIAKSKPLGSEKRLFAGQKRSNPLGSSAEPLDLTIQREQVSNYSKRQ